MKRLRHDQIPSWFSLEKYKHAKDLDYLGWSFNLMWRWLITEWTHVSIAQAMCRYYESAESLVDIKGPGISGLKIRDSLEEFTSPTAKNSAVWSLSTDFVLRWIAKVIRKESELERDLLESAKSYAAATTFREQEELRDKFSDISLDLVALDTEIYNWSWLKRDPLSVAVDIDASDATILSDFQVWLAHARQTYDAPKLKAVSDADIQSWIEFGVLPYFDLQYWCQINGFTITDSVMGNALFPDEFDVDVAERVRKVTRPRAQYIFNRQFVDAFGMQVISSERK